MWLLEVFLALLMIPATVGVPLYLGWMLGINLHGGCRQLAVSAGIALAAWLALSVKLLVLPMLHCAGGCTREEHLALGLAGYVLVSASLGLAVWMHQRSRSGGGPASAHSMHAQR